MNSAEDGVPFPQRYWAILTLIVGMVVSVLDSSLANIALPAIARDIGATAAQSIWVINAYQLAVVISLLPLASLGDIFGYRRIYSIGFAIFTAAALVSALSDSLAMLAVGRALQGLGAAGMMSVNTALVRFTYPRRQLGRGIAMTAVAVSVSSASGPSVAAAASAHPAVGASFRLGQRRVERLCLRLSDRRDQWRRPWASESSCCRRAGRRRLRRLCLGAPAGDLEPPVAAGRFVSPPDIRIVGCHFGHDLCCAGNHLRDLAVLLPGCTWPLAGCDRAVDDAVAGDGGGYRTDRR